MSRVPIRLRLTAAFALALVAVLAAVGAFVYAQLRSDLNESVDNALRSRADGVAALVRQSGSDGNLIASGGSSLSDPEEGFSQVLTQPQRGGGHTIFGRDDPVLSEREAAGAPPGGLFLERDVPGIEGTARLLTSEVTARGERSVVVVGQSLDDRDERLASLIGSFLIGGAAAVVAASLLGYLLARASLAPMEAMRKRAAEVSLARAGERLPLPAANDEVRRLGETLNHMLARLEASFERERRFVADASHELRTPLAVLKTEIEAALRRGGHTAEVRESLVAAAEEADQLAQLAEDLLLIARAAGEELPVRPEPVHVRELLERTGQRFADRAREQGRQIRVEAPAELEAELDPLRARQALGNLVDNALRHGSGDVELKARARDGALELEVRDQGPGFPPELAPRAFERFARGDAARTRGGSGLGLAIVRAIAEAHGGSATIAGGDAPTTVRLRLPLSAPSQRPLPSSSA